GWRPVVRAARRVLVALSGVRRPIGPPWLHAQHPLDLLLVARGEVGLATEATPALRRLVLEQMGPEGLAAAQPPRPGHFDALLGAAVRLHLGHRGYPSPSFDSAAGGCSPAGAAGAAAGSAATWAAGAAGATCSGAGMVPSGAVSVVCASAAGTAGAPPFDPPDREPDGFGRFSGASTMTMLRPSSRGMDSDLPSPSIWSAIRSRIFLPSSGWKTSRPRNMIVILTLWPSSRNLATCRVLVSKSPSPILGRYFISLIPTWTALRLDSLARWAASNLNFPKSMMRQTGGLAIGATSTRSRSSW